MEVVIDITDAREVEERSIARFAESGCSWKHFDGGPCCRLFSVSHYREVRDQFRDLTRSELDLVVMGQLLALSNTGHMMQAIRRRSTLPRNNKGLLPTFNTAGRPSA